MAWYGEDESDVRAWTRPCSAALFPLCDWPSSLQIRLRSLLMSVLERSIMLAAVCCRLDAIVDGSCRSNYWCRRRGEVLWGYMWSREHWGLQAGISSSLGVCEWEKRREGRISRVPVVVDQSVSLLPAVRHWIATATIVLRVHKQATQAGQTDQTGRRLCAPGRGLYRRRQRLAALAANEA